MSYLENPRAGDKEAIEKKHLDELKKMKMNGQYFNKSAKIP